MPGRTRTLALLLALASLLAACSSPEASRTRSGGPGADVGNRGRSVEMHGQAPDGMYHETPRIGQGAHTQR